MNRLWLNMADWIFEVEQWRFTRRPDMRNKQMHGGRTMSRVCIPDYEYKERLEKCVKLVAEKGYDIFLVNSNEADYANVRYFTN